MTDVLDLGPDELLTTTRSVRKRLDLDRPVPMDVVRESLEVALQAPSGSNQQGWHWLVITDAEKRKAVGEYYRQAFIAYRNSSAYPTNRTSGDADRDATQNRVADSALYLAERMSDVPVLVIGALKASADLPASNQAGLWGSLLPAAWSLQIALRARGLGSAWTTLHLQYEKEISELLGVPADVRQGVLLPVAYYTGDTFKPAKRQPLDTVLHVDGW
ncbi:L-fuco-beta-pyranose dehydrogenase [Pseudonocardia sp. Ae168_Ps1]|uniref:nitroreductase family protein n=1 Tax=unclassified Pseudonocardia TaxID=2619320 RepID=UPI00094AB6A4|nr:MULTISPECIES: nitroreductase family protein [unclassified Pseudonocardia]OLL75224.1 L-fuco-beta-pyranose dehydrogenase [Pseudonocardia sp. Ae150A_Ps1]OLL81218.1 L-fuco-beta-pyranose dehydrogenase [Pseudonocardia sp. Ae168_Ps1]OLL84667.1 L-fuco-beta-pyranose dehydrogenase [Pseudonocardia sp. Ae263_Ps1]OLL95316.1 L-fuco-beta-pyranose dehydrogenase [Pseudonocardia sp. Ae356_Ps1]